MKTVVLCRLVCFTVLITLSSAGGKNDQPDLGGVEGCGKQVQKHYQDICTKTKNDGKKVAEIKKKCVVYPKSLTDHPEVIKEMEKCNKPENACNPALMQKCAENQFKIADKLYSDKAAKLGDKVPKSLTELALSNLKTIQETCDKSKVSFILLRHH